MLFSKDFSLWESQNVGPGGETGR